ncbi:hypothetical protein HK104_011155 [Borealophlyctis nickersoniae]|nr:hypothetical protein HK104_011155 [Borealophlyctis nickersoniae]
MSASVPTPRRSYRGTASQIGRLERHPPPPTTEAHFHLLRVLLVLQNLPTNRGTLVDMDDVYDAILKEHPSNSLSTKEQIKTALDVLVARGVCVGGEMRLPATNATSEGGGPKVRVEHGYGIPHEVMVAVKHAKRGTTEAEKGQAVEAVLRGIWESVRLGVRLGDALKKLEEDRSAAKRKDKSRADHGKAKEGEKSDVKGKGKKMPATASDEEKDKKRNKGDDKGQGKKRVPPSDDEKDMKEAQTTPPPTKAPRSTRAVTPRSNPSGNEGFPTLMVATPTKSSNRQTRAGRIVKTGRTPTAKKTPAGITPRRGRSAATSATTPSSGTTRLRRTTDKTASPRATRYRARNEISKSQLAERVLSEDTDSAADELLVEEVVVVGGQDAGVDNGGPVARLWESCNLM